MGTDICQYGNHKINFTNRNFEEIAQEIKSKLDTLVLTNAEYLRFLVVSNFEGGLRVWGKVDDEKLERLKNYKEKTDWEWKYFLLDDFDYDEDDNNKINYCGIEFHGFLDFRLSFFPSSIYFSDPPDRYKTWFECENEIRDEWRKYMYQVIKLFGGDRVIYLPDQGADHFLDMFDQLPPLTFEEVEKKIILEYGEVEKTLKEYKEKCGYTSYYIDNFNDLDLTNKLSLDEYKKWYNRGLNIK